MLFSNLIKRGQIGEISLGATKSQVIEAFGEPVERFLQKKPEILKYGPVELILQRSQSDFESKLVSITFTATKNEQLLAPFVYEDLVPTKGMSQAEFRKYLGTINEPIFGCVESSPRLHLITGSGARIWFENNQFISVHRAGKGGPRPTQLSVSFANKELHEIREEAAKRKKSVAQLSAAFIRAGGNAGQSMAMKTDFTEAILSDPQVFANAWKITKIMNDEAGHSAGLVTAAWSIREDNLKRPLYVLHVQDPWGQAEREFSPNELENPESVRGALHDLWGTLLSYSANNLLGNESHNGY